MGGEEGSEGDFPLDHLARLDEQLGRPKWVVPVRQDDDLERLLRASIKLCKEGFPDLPGVAVCELVFPSGRDTEVEACQRFFREGLTLSFTRILTDDAVSTWKPDIQVCISTYVRCPGIPVIVNLNPSPPPPPPPYVHTFSLIQRDIYNNTVLLVELCVTKLDKDWFVLLELLALVFNPQSR